ncbi:MAG: hypothetical protein LBV75_06535 [Paludibacter sp.]|jgi:hypothetical protein|nr:hypothetical protein [Paludibacter sp.]
MNLAGTRGIIGGAFASVTSGIEAYGNYQDGYGFHTNDGVFNKMTNDAFTGNAVAGTYTIDPTKAQKALDFWQARNGGPILTFKPGQLKGSTDVYGNIGIGEGAFVGGQKAVREQISHEMGHYINNVNWDNGIVGGKVSNPNFINTNASFGNDGTYGYYGAIKNAGQYHSGYSIISNNTYDRPGTSWYVMNPHKSAAWQSFGWTKWFYLIPRRF